jgi:hypothetical protein
MSLAEGEDYMESLHSRGPGEFLYVSHGCSPVAAILAADVPVPSVWREHRGDQPALDEVAKRFKHGAEAFVF